MSAGSFSRTAAGNRAYYRRSFPRYLKHYQVPREKKNDNFNGTMRKYTMIGVDLITKGDIKQKKQFWQRLLMTKALLNKKNIDYKGILFKMYVI